MSFDNKRWTFEYVFYNKNIKHYEVNNQLTYSLPQGGLIYHFCIQDKKKNPTFEHAHSFDEVLRYLYDYPESFTILEKFNNEYSKQEQAFIKINQNYFKLIDLKDYKMSKELISLNNKWEAINKKKYKNLKDIYFLITYSKKYSKYKIMENIKRSNNSKHQLYSDCYLKKWSLDIIDDVISGKKNNLVKRNYSFSTSYVGIKYLVIDESYNFHLLLEFTEDNYIKFKDLTKDLVYIPKKYKDFKEYKEFLRNEFIKEGKIYKEEFSDEDVVNCTKFSIIKKF